jgi:hypothetical protein
MHENIWIKRISLIAILIFAIFLFLLGNRRVYETETQILILPQNIILASNQKAVIENFENILESLSFYDSLSKKIGNDEMQFISNEKRKEFWNSQITSEQIGESGILKITTFGQTKADSIDLNQETIKHLVLTIGQYYDIKKDLELRIVEKPLTKATVKNGWARLLGESWLYGIILYLMLFQFSPWFFLKENRLRMSGKRIDFSLNLKNKFEKITSEKNIFSKATLPNFKEELYSFSKKKKELPEKKIEKKEALPKTTSLSKEKKGASPINLPTAEEIPSYILSTLQPAEQLIEEKTEEINDKKIEEDKKENPKAINFTREATQEEVKTKLNKLLRGE